MEYYTWQEFRADIGAIAEQIRGKNRKFENIYGQPRGGLVLAVCLSHRLGGIPLVFDKKEINIDTLIVDDIADTGWTLSAYSRLGNFIVTLFYKRDCSFAPDIWLREKKEKYICFPWEEQ